MGFSVKIDGKEIRSPLLKVVLLLFVSVLIVGVTIIVATPIIMIGMKGILLGAAVFAIVAVNLHFVIRMTGGSWVFRRVYDSSKKKTSFEMKISTTEH